MLIVGRIYAIKPTQTDPEIIYKQINYEIEPLPPFPVGDYRKEIKTPQNAPVQATDDKMFIYLKESGNRPEAVSPNGCIGLGQDCLGRVQIACPDMDYLCQDHWFTEHYMIPRYHTWENAKLFWEANGWW